MMRFVFHDICSLFLYEFLFRERMLEAGQEVADMPGHYAVTFAIALSSALIREFCLQ